MKLLVALMIWLSTSAGFAQQGTIISRNTQRPAESPAHPSVQSSAEPPAQAQVPLQPQHQAQLQACRQETDALLSGDRSSIRSGQEQAFRFFREFNAHLSGLAMECGSTVSRADLTARGCDDREALRECLFNRNEAYLALLRHAGFIVEGAGRSSSDRFTKSTPPYEIDSIRILEPSSTQPGR